MMTNSCYLCGSSNLIKVQIVDKKPSFEIDYNIPKEKYRRIIYKCKICSVYNNSHNYNLDELYLASYNDATYNNKILENYHQIMDLPFDSSDNKQRVMRIIAHLKQKGIRVTEQKVLDVGSGLCVFLGEIKKYGVKTYCIDPDSLSVNHALRNVRVDSAFEGEFLDYTEVDKFDLITFNKVLEHVKNPVEMLFKAKRILKDNGTIYIELPDGEAASINGEYIDREEFYLEHYTVFGKKSIKFLAEKAGLKYTEINSIHEPSKKYTLFSFLSIS